jgi:hypothetical protein
LLKFAKIQMSFTAQTGYRRQGPRAICQDAESLLAVRETSFDLADPDFVDYFVARTGVRINDNGRGAEYLDHSPCSPSEWSEVCRDIMQGDDTPTRLLRGKLEDCWELYQNADEDADGFEPPRRGNVCRDALGEDVMVVTATPGYVCPAW